MVGFSHQRTAMLFVILNVSAFWSKELGSQTQFLFKDVSEGIKSLADPRSSDLTLEAMMTHIDMILDNSHTTEGDKTKAMRFKHGMAELTSLVKILMAEEREKISLASTETNDRVEEGEAFPCHCNSGPPGYPATRGSSEQGGQPDIRVVMSTQPAISI
eukprot:maker-scaffold116_size340332-snap-gene-0.18 protein:Tk07644 transcript:maker-scaffold116_size340332-snap-gene-0.18-mRNA-1 annotation:"conserved hypothetical protein"